MSSIFYILKILILRFSSIGDIILTTPVIRCLKTQMPNCQVHYATKKSFASILSTNPYVDKLFLLENDLSILIHQLKLENYDLIIDLHHNLRTGIIKFQLGKKAFSFPKLNVEKWMRVNLKIDKLPRMHIVDRYMSTLSTLNIKNDMKGLDYFIPDSEKFDQAKLPSEFVAFVIGAKFATKRLPNDKIIEICNRIQYPVVLLGGKEDVENSLEIMKSCNHHVTNLCGQLSLNESASVVEQSALVITHDTGLMHIAAAFHKKIISIWGNTIPEFGMYPYLPQSEKSEQLMMETKKLSCRPCSKIGYDQCPKGHFKCMNQIDVNTLIEGVAKMMMNK